MHAKATALLAHPRLNNSVTSSRFDGSHGAVVPKHNSPLVLKKGGEGALKLDNGGEQHSYIVIETKKAKDDKETE